MPGEALSPEGYCRRPHLILVDHDSSSSLKFLSQDPHYPYHPPPHSLSPSAHQYLSCFGQEEGRACHVSRKIFALLVFSCPPSRRPCRRRIIVVHRIIIILDYTSLLPALLPPSSLSQYSCYPHQARLFFTPQPTTAKTAEIYPRSKSETRSGMCLNVLKSCQLKSQSEYGTENFTIFHVNQKIHRDISHQFSR